MITVDYRGAPGWLIIEFVQLLSELCGACKKCGNYYKQESCAVAKMTARCALYMGALNFRDSLTMPAATVPNIFHVLLFQLTLWMFLQNLKSVALPIPEIIGGTQKIWAVPGYAHAPFSPKFLMGFYSDWPVNAPAKFEVRSFTCFWNKRG